VKNYMLRTLGLLALALPVMAQTTPRPATEFVFNLLGKKTALLSSYKGKTVVFACLSATCPHCQAFVPGLNEIQRDYASKGVVVLATLFNPDAEVSHPGFVQQFKPEFPLGWSTRELVHAWLGYSVMKQTYVPIVAFIDKKGMIIEQHTGDDPFMTNPKEAVRARLDAMFAAPVVGAKKGASKK
jgi:thiol-disulfide isomerase/thioredoxin